MMIPLAKLLGSALVAQVQSSDDANAANAPAAPATQPHLDTPALDEIQAGFNQAADAPASADAPVGLSHWLTDWQQLGFLDGRPWLQTILAMAVLAIVVYLLHLVVQWVMVKVVKRLFQRTSTWWDDMLLEYRVFHRIELLIPVIAFERGFALVPHVSDGLRLMVTRVALATIVILLVMSFSGLLSAINAIYSKYPISRGRPIKGYLQVVKILIFIAGGIMIITAIMGLEPLWFVSGIGAVMAVILLIFRDTLLSLVAGIQLVNNDLIRVGDWIEMPQFNADGDVTDISLNVVKVQNWDKTLSVIPTHMFLNHSFKNWRSMSESGGRRIKRSVHLDMATIRFLTSDEIARFSRFTRLSQYIKDKSGEIAAYNRAHCPADAADIIANARHLTNVGTFRAYLLSYLRSHPKIHQDMTLLVRQLEPTAQGLPLEIYVFTNDTRWAMYEDIQGDIFDHVLSIAPEFGLRVYQQPAGSDVVNLAKAARHDEGSDASETRPAIRPLGFDEKTGE